MALKVKGTQSTQWECNYLPAFPELVQHDGVTMTVAEKSENEGKLLPLRDILHGHGIGDNSLRRIFRRADVLGEESIGCFDECRGILKGCIENKVRDMLSETE